jgi:hypothetical protein
MNFLVPTHLPNVDGLDTWARYDAEWYREPGRSAAEPGYLESSRHTFLNWQPPARSEACGAKKLTPENIDLPDLW